jgi:putative methyltransferase (TIGR04325 family)
MLNRLSAATKRYGIAGTVRAAMRKALSISNEPPELLRGVFSTYEEAIAAVSPGLLAGYNNQEIVDECVDHFSTILPSDAPVLQWLERLLPSVTTILDAGGHVGVKYRAFREHLRLDDRQVNWIVYDTPAMVRAGRQRATREGLERLSFIEKPKDAPLIDLMLCSGLLQFLDIPFPELMRQLPARPRHLLLNKVATRDGRTVVTLVRIAGAEVPYQIRDRAEFLRSLDSLGYEIVDEWVLPEFTRPITADPSLGASTSRGYYARLSRP